MPSSTTKKVVVRRFDREPVHGFVNPQSYLRPEGAELLSPSGNVVLVAMADIKSISFVRDFDANEPSAERKLFTTRPKMNGLWVRMQMRDGDVLDGILSNDLLQLSPLGFNIVPPDSSANNQKLFIPKEALTEIQVLGVVGSPLSPKRKRPAKTPDDQIGLFEEPA